MALNDVPLSGQTLNDTRNPIRNNFLTINTAFSVNHGEYGTANAGMHEFVQFTDRTGNTPVFGGRSGMWSENGTFSLVPEIWVNTKAGVGFNQYAMTESTLSNTPTIGDNTNGFTVMPSGIILKWGVQTINGATAVNLNAVGPAFGAAFSAQATCQTASAQSVSVVSLNAATLTLIANNFPVYWFVIGRR